MNEKKNQLTTLADFRIARRYEEMDPELLAELQEQLEDLDNENDLFYRTIKLPAAGGTAYQVQGDDDEAEYLKEFVGVLIFTHRMNGYWSGSYGEGGSEDKIPVCSSMDGKTGLWRDSGEMRSCQSCSLNQFGSAADSKGVSARGKACKNMRRLYLMRSGDPNFYLLTAPPTSIRDLNRQLIKIMDGQGIPYTRLIVGLKLEKAVNANGVAYSKIVLEKKGLLPPEAAAIAKELHQQIKEQYQYRSLTLDDCTAAPTPVQRKAVEALEAPPWTPGQEPPLPVSDEDFVEVEAVLF